MPRVLHPKRALGIPPQLELLEVHGVRYVLTGSVAARVYGVDVQPGDLDITPALDHQNLPRLANVLKDSGRVRWLREMLRESGFSDKEAR